MKFDNFEVNGIPQVLEVHPLLGGYFHVYINRYFITTISTVNGELALHFNNNSWLTMDESDIIIGLIESGEIPTL